MQIHHRLTFRPACLFLACLLIASVSSVIAAPKIPLELEEIREDISLLNLLRGLYLSKEQLGQILELATQAQTERQTALKPFLDRKEQILADFRDLRDSLYLAPGNEKKPQEKAHRLDQQMKEAVGGVSDRIYALEEKAAAVLSSAQLCILDDFKACLIPPKDLGNPVRVGQAGAAEGLLGKLTDLIHCAPESLWKARGDRLLQRVVEKLEDKSGEISPALKQDLNRRLHEIAAKIRACNDIDFAVKKHDLAKELLVINPDKGLKHGHRKNGPVARWLLSDVTMRVLPQWIKAMENTDFTAGDTDSNDQPLALEQTEALAKLLMTLRQMHQKRIKAGARLPEYETFVAPVKNALQGHDLKKLLQAVSEIASSLSQASPGHDVVKLLSQCARGYAKVIGLPLFNPQQDPFGLAEELKAAAKRTDHAAAANELQKMLGVLQEFKRP